MAQELTRAQLKQRITEERHKFKRRMAELMNVEAFMQHLIQIGQRNSLEYREMEVTQHDLNTYLDMLDERIKRLQKKLEDDQVGDGRKRRNKPKTKRKPKKK